MHRGFTVGSVLVQRVCCENPAGTECNRFCTPLFKNQGAAKIEPATCAGEEALSVK
jgi:hypothetical protein